MGGIVFLFVCYPRQRVLLECGQIVLTNSKDRPLVVADQSIFVGVYLRPLLILEFEVKHVTLKQRSNTDSLFNENGKILSKQEERDEVILKFNDELDDHINSL